jgi:hypothetical protein
MAVITVELGKSYYHLQREMMAWCTEHIGKNPNYCDWAYSEPQNWEGLGNWCVTSMFGNTFFYFKEEKYKTAFVLRWV